MVTCIICAAASLGAFWLTIGKLSNMQSAQSEQTDLLNKVLRRIPGVVTFGPMTVTNQAGHEIPVSVTQREGETVEEAFQRFVDAVTLARASTV